jgi:hypothetical protein
MQALWTSGLAGLMVHDSCILMVQNCKAPAPSYVLSVTEADELNHYFA